MTFQPIAGEPLAISAQAKRVMEQAAAKRRKPARRRTRQQPLDLTAQLYREHLRRQLEAGCNPLLHDAALVAELEEAYPSVARAVSAWYDRFTSRPR